MATPLALASLALVLTGPVPALLARASWPVTVPRAALTLWQSVAAAAVLAALGAGLSAATGVVSAPDPSPWAITAHVLALVLTVIVAGRLAWAGHRYGTAVRARRRRHRAMVDLVARADGRAPGAVVVDAPARLAYCLPGLRSRVVISDLALDELADDEIRAVIEHERSHLRARHDLLLEAFTVLHTAFPRWVRSRTALTAVAGLVEMLADDAARRRTGDLPLARALVTLADSAAPTGTLAAGTPSALTRLRRLGNTADGRVRRLAVAGAAYTVAAALVITPTVTIALPWLTTTLPHLVP